MSADGTRFSHSSKGRLTGRDAGRFPGPSLFDKIGRAICEAGCLPRKELFEAWETARRVRRLFRGGRVVDVAGGHGLLAHVMLLLDDTSPGAVVVDPLAPRSAGTLTEALAAAWPRLAGRLEFIQAGLDDIELFPTDVLVSSHACGSLTDRILDRAVQARARVAVLPCCHDFETCDFGAIDGWLNRPLAIDIMRAITLEKRGYRVWTQTIPAEVTPQNRLLLGSPEPAAV
ncbi:MAG: methyltransferase [Vicinamibacterales bacterium]